MVDTDLIEVVKFLAFDWSINWACDEKMSSDWLKLTTSCDTKAEKMLGNIAIITFG